MARSKLRSVCSCVFALSLATAAHAHAGADELRPSGGEDTAQLQAALTKCSQQHKPCDIRLGAGVFHTDVLLVTGFSGSITGHGESRTIIRPITTRPLRSTANPYFGDPTLAQPYPVLLHFAAGGRIALSGFTMDFPATMTVQPYNHYLIGQDGLGITDYLQAAIMVEGDRSAELSMSHVTIKAVDADNYWGSNVASAVRFVGTVRLNGTLTDFTDETRKLQSGRFLAHDNNVARTGNGLWVEDANNIQVSIVDNDIDTRIYAVPLTDLGRSHIQTVRNRISSELDGVLVFQTFGRPAEDPSDFVIALNKFTVNAGDRSILGIANDAVATVDDLAFADEPIGGTLLANVDVWGNDIRIAGNTDSGIDVFSDGPGKIRVFGNRIHGNPTNESGIYVDYSEGTFVAGNDLRALDPPFGDVALRANSSNCTVIEPGDTVSDLGTNNHVIGVPKALPAATATAATSIAKSAGPAAKRAPFRPGFSKLAP